MLKKINILIIGILSFVMTSCSFVDMRLVRERAEENWAELKKVIDRYEREGDREKIKAVEFLMSNMPYHSYIVSDDLEEAMQWYPLMVQRSSEEWQMLSDSIAACVDVNAGLRRIWDVRVLDSAFLCDNIDFAFKVWREQPWGKNVDFDTFCNYVLPYRIGDEVPQAWRREYYDKYSTILDDFIASDSLDIEDPAAAFRYVEAYINASMKMNYTSISPVTFPHIGPHYAQYFAGSCKDICSFLIYLCRSLGIPCALNYRQNDNQYWITGIGKEGDECSMGYLGHPIVPNKEDELYPQVKTHVFRLTYSVNRQELGRLVRDRVRLPYFFRVPLFEDVTSSFTDHYMKRLVLSGDILNEKVPYGSVMYLCSSLRDGWIIEDYAQRGWGDIVFEDIQKGDVLCLAVEENGTLRPVTVPFMVHPYTEELIRFEQNGLHQEVVLFSKYCLFKSEKGLIERMRKGVFEGADDASFTDPDTLFIVQQVPERLYTEGDVYRYTKGKKYDYLRYSGGYDASSGVAEVRFLDKNGVEIGFSDIIGTANIEDPSHDYIYAYDGDPLTSFQYHLTEGGWTGIRPSEPSEVGSVVYAPQNRINYIYVGDTYELLYYDNGWYSLGLQTAESDSLIFRNVPKGNLLYLRNLSGGVQEMVFTYENGRQSFHGCGQNITYLRPPAQTASTAPWDCRYTYLTPSEDWASPDFDDSSWETGQGPFGQDKACVTAWSSPRLFVRYKFDASSDAAAVLGYVLKGRAELWLNGAKVTDLYGERECKEVILPEEHLRQGENLLAVKCYNDDIMSDDVMLDIGLI